MWCSPVGKTKQGRNVVLVSCSTSPISLSRIFSNYLSCFRISYFWMGGRQPAVAISYNGHYRGAADPVADHVGLARSSAMAAN
jgi:hypothetical protein